MPAQELMMGVVFAVLYANSKFKIPMGAAGVFKMAPVLAITTIMAIVPSRKKGSSSFFILVIYLNEHVYYLSIVFPQPQPQPQP
jgi:hypothetical protein